MRPARQTRPYPVWSLRSSPAPALKRVKVALGVVSFLALGLACVLCAAGSQQLPAVGAYCVISAAVVVAIVLRLGFRELRGAMLRFKRRLAIRTLRRQLDDLPETAHPFPGG